MRFVSVCVLSDLAADSSILENPFSLASKEEMAIDTVMRFVLKECS